MEYLCTTNVTSDDKLTSFNFITNPSSLFELTLDTKSNNRVVFRKDFIDKYYPYDFYELMKTIRKLNSNLIVEVEDEFTITDDDSFIETIKDNLNEHSLDLLIRFKSHEFISAIKFLIDSYESNKKLELEGASAISSLRETINELRDQLEESREQTQTEIDNKVYVQNKLSVLVNRINYNHNVGVDERMLFRSENNNYDKVLYIKELSRVQYMDTFVDALQEILRLLYEIPTRVLTIEGYYANGKVRQYPHLKPHYNLTENDVISSDILMLGFQPKLFRDIMRNPSNISILIIFDRGGYQAPHLFGNNVEYLFSVSDIEDLPQGIPQSRVISYRPENLNIPHIKGFNSLSVNEKVQRYSSLPIIKQIVKLLE